MKSRAHRYRYVRHVAMSCFPDGRASVAPPTLSYASPQSWTYGVAISTLSPTTTGATSFAVLSGTLPTGVSLNTTTGDITGTPTVAKVAANVVIRATGPGGTADATINIAVPSPLYTSLVEYWNLDEASGNRAGSHAGLTLTDNNTVTSQATGGPDGGRCAQFTAANTETLSRASEAALQIGDIDYTLSIHLYLDSLPATSCYPAKKWGGSTNEFALEILAGQQRTLYAGSGSSVAEASTPSTSWFHLLTGYNASTNNLFMSTNNAAATEAASATGGTAGDSAFVLGGAIGFQTFDGRMAYVGLWKRLLTAAERTWLYNAGAGRAYSALATYDGG